ncbi:nucleotide sugar dehydrogenase, partial [Bacteriovorax sp. DB6_IX]|uniref:nucleotide sugar dehydrogenase n=1 Tax=Bacteriovorax sp. DB6_IX TaxID=1353530 RepID=UPI00038A2BDA
VSVFGLGYVGCVSIACLANSGHQVIGCDIKPEKVDKINNGIPTIVEKGVDYLINNNKERISATLSVEEAVKNSDISIMCVGTPSDEDGRLNTTFLERAILSVAEVLKTKDSFHVISIRSTVPAGTNESLIKKIENISGKKIGLDFDLVSNPEFLREGSAIEDYVNPIVTVLGVHEENSKAVSMMRELYADIDGEFKVVSVKSAEIIKYVNNSWHALKIAFTNEVGDTCKALGIDPYEVMGLFIKDNKLNLSPYYMKPGYAFGGPCLPKDLRGLVNLAKDNELDLKVLGSVEESNNYHIDVCFRELEKLDLVSSKIAFLGVSFKAGTDDLRYSTKFDLCKKIFMINQDLIIHDVHVKKSLDSKINDGYIRDVLGDMAEKITDDLDEAINNADIVIFSHNEPYYRGLGKKLNKNQVLFELSKLNEEVICRRHGVCW